jgi:hypothetical protein
MQIERIRLLDGYGGGRAIDPADYFAAGLSQGPLLAV